MLRNPKYLYGSQPCNVPAKLNLGEFLIHKLKKHGNKIAMINAATQEKLTYDGILQASMNVAVSLVKIGVKKGDVVGICAEKISEFWPTVIGIACAGAIMTPYSYEFIKDELKHVMDLSKPKYLFCSKRAYETHGAIFKSLDYLDTIILYGEDRIENSLLYNDLAIVSDRSIITKNVEYDEFVAIDVDGQNDTVFLMYSSGTTGLPKAVMQTHLNTIVIYSVSGTVDPALKILNITPWYHVFGLMSGLMYLSHGAHMVYLPKFEMDLYLSTIEKYKINQLVLIPSVVMALSKISIKYDVSSVEVILCAASVLETKVIDAVEAKFRNLEAVVQGYGMTETTFMVTIDDYFKNKIFRTGSVGKVISDTVIKISDIVTREPLGPYQRGEICVKGPTILKGYIGIDNKNDFDDEGFLKTGDIGYYDDDKYLYIVERLKELIKYNGYQVPPAEVEAVLLQHSGVRDAGVIGLPHASSGEVPLAFVVLQKGVNVTEIELQRFVAERLSNPKHLRGGVRFVDEIPRTGSGKILRKNLRQMIE
ncbi:luciferin 4-monooxygenase-like [Battus philenor]|uniref:luciferin 4-monooxygenase-like n=1 Tax=Battus philenor TaxID=42288 RepID=UPI0035D01BE1